MTVLWGAVLAAGLLLVASPWLWPPRPAIGRASVDGPTTRLLHSAGLGHVRPRTLALVSVVLAAVAAALAWVLTPIPALAVVAGVAAGAAPAVWLHARAARLRRSRRALWPDVCDLLIASVRAGMSLPDAVSSLAESAPPALRAAFAAFGGDMSASGHFDSSALRLKARLSDPVADRIVETLRMTRQIGGTELGTVLRALSAAVRADAALRAEVEARQSWVRGAAVLGVVAPWVILALLSLRPEGARAYASAEGVVLIVVGAVFSVVAYRLMMRIGRLPEPRRWFG